MEQRREYPIAELEGGETTDMVELGKKAAAGQGAAWNEIVDRFASPVWAAARAANSSEVRAQQVFRLTWLRLFDHLHYLPAETIGHWLEDTVARESTRIIRLGQSA
jgi:hypothetical protein